MNKLNTVPMAFSREMAVYTRLNKHDIFIFCFGVSSSLIWDRNGKCCRFSHKSPYFRALFQSIWITIKISKSWNIQRTLQWEEYFSRCLSFSTLSRVKWTQGRSHGELGKSVFWKFLFPWSDRLDQTRVLKLSENLDRNPSKQFPLNKYFLFTFCRENS